MAKALDREVQHPCVFSVPANTSSPGFFSTGVDSPVMGLWSIHDSPADDPPVDRHAFAGPHDDGIVGPHVGHVDFVFVLAAADAGRAGPQRQQGGNARSRAADCHVFQRLADEHDENDLGGDEEPGRRVLGVPAHPECRPCRQRNGQVRGDLAVQQSQDPA